MLVHIQGKTYKVKDNLKKDIITLLLSKATNMYDSMPDTRQVIIDGFARGYLYDMENKLIENGFDRKKAALLRPDKKEDATKKLIDIMTTNVLAASEYINVELEIEGDEIVALSYGMTIPNGSKKT